MNRGFSIANLVSALVMAALVFLLGVIRYHYVALSEPAKAVALPPSISVIQGMSELATTRVHISDVIDGANAHFQGRWSLHGEIIVGVDLSKVAYIRVDADKREAVLSLPHPHLISTKVDHERSEELYVKAVAWLPLSKPELLRDEVWKHADRKLQKQGQESGHLERAKSETERVLQSLFKGVGWHIQFAWQETAAVN